MDTILPLLGAGILEAMQPTNFMMIVIGCTVGLLVGAMPGLGSVNGVAILLPITFLVPPTAAIPPEFNTVGAGSTNQLPDAIGGQSQQPIQTYVVTGEVSTSQELERNIVTGATIG